MNAHVDPIAPDEAAVRTFFQMLHEAAGISTEGMREPGVLQLSRVHPADGKLQVVARFRIGDVERVAAQALADASAGFNVYVEGRTVRPDLHRSKRGDLVDTVAVFALVVDADADKGRDATLPDEAEPSLCVESSPGNRHEWFFIAPALPAAEAQTLGSAIRAAGGGDDDTGNVTQPYRVAGTPNYPGAKKEARGRVVSPTSIVTEGRSYTADELRMIFPDAPQGSRPATSAQAAPGSADHRAPRPVDALLASLSSKRTEDLAATGIFDRSAHVLRVTGWLKGDGYSLEETVALWEAFPAGAAVDKYGERLEREVARIWNKVSDDPTAEAEAVELGRAAAERIAANLAKGAGGTEGGRYREEADGTIVDVETGEVVSGNLADDRPADPRDFPDAELKSIPGVVGEIVDWICDWTAEPIRIHALGAALTIVGTLVSRKVFTEVKPCGPVLYIGAIAPSGMGKQHPQDCIRLAMDAVMPNSSYCIGWQKSGPKLTNALLQKASRLMVVDEFTSKMTGIRNRVAATHETNIIENLLVLWGTNTGILQPDASITNGGDITLRRLALSLYGASPIRQFAESLTPKDVENGWLNRFLVLPQYGSVPVGADPLGIMSIPDDLAEKLRRLHNCLPETQMVFDNRGDICLGAPHLAPFSADANAMNEENKHYEKSCKAKSNEEAAYTLFARYAEQIKRIALVLACGRSWQDLSHAQIEADDMAFAARLVRWSVDELFAMVRREMTENLSEQQYKFVLGIIRKARTTTRNDLTRKIRGRITQRDLDAIVKGLEEAEEIETDEVKTRGRPRQIIRFKA